MFDLVAYNPWLVFSNLILALIMMWIIFPAFDINKYIPKERIWLTVALLLVFVEFSFWGSDWFHLYDLFPNIMTSTAPVEDFYYWLAQKAAPNNYLLFRFLIWGVATVLLVKTFKRVNVDFELTLAVFIGAFMIWFSYGRVSLSMAMSFLGLSIIFNPITINRHRFTGTILEAYITDEEESSITSFRWISVLIGILLAYCAIYLHHSGIYSLFIIVLTIITGFFSQRWIIIGLVTIALVLLMFPDVISRFLLAEIQTNIQDLSSAVTRSQQYMERTDHTEGITYTFGLIIEKIPYYMLAISAFIHWNDDIPNDIKAFMRAILLIVISSSLLYLFGGMNMQVIYDRFIKFAMIPATLVLSHCLVNGSMPKWHRATLIIAIGSSLFQLTYMWYCAIMLQH